MKCSLYLPVIFLLFLSGGAIAQYSADYTITVKDIDDIEMKLPWVGGLNNPQFSPVDLDNNGIEDLFIFDRTGNKVLTFINKGGANLIDYIYAPQYESHFPAMESWSLLVDYNCDNIADIFAFTNFPATGIRAYEGYYDTDNTIRFTLIDSVIEYPFGSNEVNLFVTSG
jgi:hypothetical protein